MSSRLLLASLRYNALTARPRCAAVNNHAALSVVSQHGCPLSIVDERGFAGASNSSSPSNASIIRSFSSSSSTDEKSGGVGGILKNVRSPVEWWRNRQESDQAEKYKQRVHQMVNKPDWTLNDMLKELEEATSSWTSKIPGVNNNKEITIAKQMQKTVSGVVDVVGANATIENLDKMKRVDKLQAAVKAEQSLEEINIFIQQFSTASMMHRVLRKRKLEGKRIPETPEAMQEIIQAEGKSVLTKSQKEQLKRNAMKEMKKSMR